MANVKVSKIGLIDMLKFKNQVKVREKVIDSAEAKPFPKSYATNENARMLHPEQQSLRIAGIVAHSPDVKTFIFENQYGKPVAYFRAGQYLSFRLELGGSVITRPISICSSPAEALKGRYAITVKRAGFASDYMLDNWKEGDMVTASAPLGNFYYTKLRDAKKVIGLAGGSGITPFLSMALAIADGTEDFELTLLYGSRTKKDILFWDVLDACQQRSNGKVKVVHVLSGEELPGYEHGFITADLIRKYMGGEQCSIFICGPQVMYDFAMKEIATLNMERKWVRRELFGASKTPWLLPGYPAECKDKTYHVTLHQCGKEYTFDASANESLLIAIERTGIKAPAHCRSGECGWCRSRLLNGQVFIPDSTDGRRAADKQTGYIHPCVSYPMSDMTLDMPLA